MMFKNMVVSTLFRIMVIPEVGRVVRALVRDRGGAEASVCAT